MKTEDGQNFTRVITFKEWYGNQTNPDEWAERIYKDCIVMGVKPNKAIVDGAMLDKLQDGSVGIGKTMMKKWKELNKDIEWCPMVAANKNRIGRVAVVHNWLSSPKYVDKLGREKSDLPYWLITQNCINLIRTLPLLTYDEHRVNDVDTSLEDHSFDSTGYFLYKVKFTAVKAGAHSYHIKSPTVQLQYNASNQQLAFDPKEFANRF